MMGDILNGRKFRPLTDQPIRLKLKKNEVRCTSLNERSDLRHETTERSEPNNSADLAALHLDRTRDIARRTSLRLMAVHVQSTH